MNKAVVPLSTDAVGQSAVCKHGLAASLHETLFSVYKWSPSHPDGGWQPITTNVKEVDENSFLVYLPHPGKYSVVVMA